MRLVLALLVLILLGAGGFLAYRQLTHETLDLTALAPYAATERIDKLIARIQAQPIPAEGFSFVALGDSRSNYGVALQVFQEAAKEKPAFVLSNGDIVRRGLPEEYVAHHMRLVQAIAPIPFIGVPGNHEEGPNDDFEAYRAIYGEERFSFDYGNCRVVGVNNCDFWGLSNEELRYLDAELGKPGADHKFVVFHMPPKDLAVYAHSEDGRGFRRNSAAMRKLFARHQVDHVFMGHVHGYATMVEDGVRYTVTGGAGASLTESLGEEGGVHNFVVVHVTPDGLKQEVVRLVNGTWVRSPVV